MPVCTKPSLDDTFGLQNFEQNLCLNQHAKWTYQYNLKGKLTYWSGPANGKCSNVAGDTAVYSADSDFKSMPYLPAVGPTRYVYLLSNHMQAKKHPDALSTIFFNFHIYFRYCG